MILVCSYFQKNCRARGAEPPQVTAKGLCPQRPSSFTPMLVSQGATNLRKSKTRSVKAVNSPQVNKERTFRVHLLVESFCISIQKYILQQGFRLSRVLKMFLTFHHISSSCCYKIVLIKEEGIDIIFIILFYFEVKPHRSPA